MPLGARLGRPRRLLILLLATAVALAAALGWLSWRLLEQDRALETQRIQERLDPLADLAVNALRRALSSAEEQLAGLLALPDAQLAAAAARQAEALAEDAVIVVLRPGAVDAYPPGRLLYYPLVAGPGPASTSVFAAAEALEFQQKDAAGAAAAFRELARSKDPAIRSEALLGLARNLRKAGQLQAALQAYRELADLDTAVAAGLPAALVARHARCALLEELKQPGGPGGEAEALLRDLDAARWRLTRPAYLFYSQEARRWTGRPGQTEAGVRVRLALAAAAEALWEEWPGLRSVAADPPPRSLWAGGHAVLLVRRSSESRGAALLAGPVHLRQQWLGGMEELVSRQGVRLSLSDAAGHLVLGSPPEAGKPQVSRAASDTRLPWNLRAASADPGIELARLTERRRLLFAGLLLLTALVLAGGGFLARVVTRELETARAQSDFVSALSHEFRTPLTSLRQFAEMLARGRAPSEERRQRYYDVLERESQRLHRLVESLLNFGRMEAGAQQYRFEPVDPAALVTGVVAEFQQAVAARNYRIELAANGAAPLLRADPEALERALWNLLDNAVKYSPECRTVWVELAAEGSQVAIRVRDRGVGIAAGEQKRVFQKFVRGEGASGVTGTGIGLAMVRHIVRAHRGRIRVESQPGVGSTFTVLLPAGGRR